MRMVLTGAGGFLGWHTQLRAFATNGITLDRLSLRESFDASGASTVLNGADRVVHIAGVNRGTDEEVENGNIHLAEQLVAALKATQQKPRTVVYANSIQATLDNPYGRGKQGAAEILRAACDQLGIVLLDLKLPNLFGEEGKPKYNSVVATFAHQVATGSTPVVAEDRELTLMHSQEAARLCLEATTELEMETAAVRILSVSEIAQTFMEFHRHYVVGELPALADTFARDLFNVYRAAVFKHRPVIKFETRADDRGYLVETMKSHGGEGQTFFSTTKSGITRGDHFHLRKIERFVVLSGEATIRLRKMFTTDVLEFAVSGCKPVAIDMPVGWVHSITNTGKTDLFTQFWTNEIFDSSDPDTFYEKVL
ncbi:polysaccharide biosynthesis C-terminal domain-containing protein [Paeniglutamicibacter gangotriensis]|nr:NAD-dependent epimerase/dehydratase family protein [Paeniglutamicibacter gangotriensis]